MTIVAKCACGKTLEVFDEAAGKTFKCRGCGATVPIPGGTPAARS